MTDKNPVHNVVQHINNLRHNGGNSQFKKQSSDWFRSEKCLIIFHGSPSYQLFLSSNANY